MSSTGESGGGSISSDGISLFIKLLFFISFQRTSGSTLISALTTIGIIGADGYFLLQLLLHYVNVLHPDAANVPGMHVHSKLMEGQEGLTSRAWLGRDFFGCIFPGIQDTTHVTQETYQNYGKFKSFLHQHNQQLLNELY